MHGSLKVKRQPLLDAAHARALRQVHKQYQIQDQRCRQNRIAAQEVDLDLHGVAQPTENVDIVPPLLGVTAGRVVFDADLVVKIPVEIGIQLALQDVLQRGRL